MIKLCLLFLTFSCALQQPPAQTKYLRKDWRHWTDIDRNCLNTRHEILKARSIAPVSFDRNGCKIIRGVWKDYYYPEVHTLSRKVDIDHLVPLKNAHETGGAGWTKSEKEIFANDPQNLVITNLKYNRQKGAKGIDEWLPVHREYACKYIKDWLKLKSKYSLEVTNKELSSVSSLNCP